MKLLLNYYNSHPLRFILIVALLFRLSAAFFSEGYGMSDDHYKIIEEANKQRNGEPSKFWTPGFDENLVSKRAMLYPVANYQLFTTLESIGIDDPKIKMLINRILHALLSLLTVYLTYLIAMQLSVKKVALEASWLAALFWLMPMLGVRNLIEVVSIPFLMGGTYFFLRSFKEDKNLINYCIAGFLLGLAFVIRYQTGAFSLGLGIILLFHKKWKAFLTMSFLITIPLLFNHVVIESWIYGFYPFEKPFNYLANGFNLENARKYVAGPWYLFLLLFLGLFIPPYSFLLLRGGIAVSKKQLVIVLPFLIFFLFHSIFPGKQERFILPVMLFFPIIGLIGLEELQKTSNWFIKRPNFIATSKKIFWTINILLLFPMTLSSTKLARVDACYALHEVPSKEKNCFLLVGNKVSDLSLIPWFYANVSKEPIGFRIADMDELEKFKLLTFNAQDDWVPDYLFLFDHEQKKEKLAFIKTFYPELELVFVAENSLVDNIMQKLNKRNRNFEIEVYKLGKFLKE